MKPSWFMAFLPLATCAQNAPSDTVIERGQDYAVYGHIQTFTDASGRTYYQTNEFTLLENALHYLDHGEWKESQDVIEPFPGGAVARYGPHQAIFSAELNAQAVFDIKAADGRRVRGGIRAIQMSDLASGEAIIIGTVKESLKGQLLPPNRIIYAGAFDGIQADVLLDWKHNVFSHDVILREQPDLPADWNPANVRLEVATEFIVDAEPELRPQLIQREGQPELEDHAVIHFGSLAMVMGKAFRTAVDPELALGGLNDDEASIPVQKQWYRTEDGRNFLVESVGWLEVWPMLKDLPVAALATRSAERNSGLTGARPTDPANVKASSPMQVAAVDYEPRGCVLDFVIIPDQGTPTTLLAGTTYYIKTSYYSGSSVTFQPGCVIKFKQNAYMLLYGPVSFPGSGVSSVFTSRNDNTFGQIIAGVAGETNSDGNPTLHQAAKAIWIYYVTFNTTVQNARIRWAQRGIHYDQNQGVTASHIVLNSLFEYSTIGIYINIPSGSGVTLSNVKKCGVASETSGWPFSGYMTEDCGVVCTARVNNPAQDTASGDPNKNSQSECSFVVVDANRIVASFFDTHLSQHALGWLASLFTVAPPPRSTGWSVSTDGGATFTDNGAIPPTVPASFWESDAGDPVMARNTANGHIYLLVNPSREPATWKGFRLWKSTNNGQSFSLVHTDVFNGLVDQGDKDMIAVNNFPGLANSGHVYVAGGSQVGGGTLYVTRSSNGGANWTPPVSFGQGWSPDIAIRPNGTVYVFYLDWTYNNGIFTNYLKYRWLRVGQSTWNGPRTIDAHTDRTSLYSDKGGGSGNLKRSNSATEDDHFVSNAYPRVAVNPVTGRVYLVYADLPYAGSSTDRGDIFINEGLPIAGDALEWTGARKVNNDATLTDQWNPSIAVNPAGTQLFIGYYSRQVDPSQNKLIKAYGAKAGLANGLWGATFDVFPVSASLFTNLFPGTLQSTPSDKPWLFDHVWTQADVCLDSSAMVSGASPCPPESYSTLDTYQHFCADDYTWASADSTYFYFAWCDRSETCTITFDGVPRTRADPNIRLAKIEQ